ncbi:hypothetical protein [Rhodothermus profundi]|uniref:hypothetical protein n=1 Tax=Rhodothermus profundi TaxID=633813 RepID=UPI001160C4EF|nr:hypothetical protein [Rhodothermus profundi]
MDSYPREKTPGYASAKAGLQYCKDQGILELCERVAHEGSQVNDSVIAVIFDEAGASVHHWKDNLFEKLLEKLKDKAER